ncbi:MAG: hypothetical protein ABIO82_05785 [Ginsengibacter sp.]
MKEIQLFTLMAFTFFTTNLSAQTQKGNFLIGSDLANLNMNLSGGGAFRIGIDPKIAFFVHDKFAVGGFLSFGLSTAKGASTIVNYGVGPLARYYLHKATTDMTEKGSLFLEANTGIQGVSVSGGSSTNGLGLAIGPGYAYFITQNIGLETLLKYNGIVGFGNQTYQNDLSLGFGFQLYLGRNKARQLINKSQ